MWKSLAVIALVAACEGVRPGTLVNARAGLGGFTPHDGQLLYQTGQGARVVDLRTLTTFDLGPPGFVVTDVSDDGRVVVMIEPDRPVLAVVRDGKLRGTVRLAQSPSYQSLSPDGRYFAGTWASTATAFDSDEIFLVDLETLTTETIPARRRGKNVQGLYWTHDSGGIIVTVFDDPHVNRDALAARDFRYQRLVYDIASDTHARRELGEPDLVTTKWYALQRVDGGGPAECVDHDQQRVAGGWRRLADIREMKTHPHSNHPIRSWGFFPSCAMHIVHDGTLWLIDTNRRAVSLGTVESRLHPVAFAGSPFTRK